MTRKPTSLQQQGHNWVRLWLKVHSLWAPSAGRSAFYAGFGDIAERWQYVQTYVFSERLAYAFLWDIFLYSIFQPWLIGDNIQNVKADTVEFVNVVKFVPVVGLVAYLLCLEKEE
nr:unnamed protein product [Digitaria exilis]